VAFILASCTHEGEIKAAFVFFLSPNLRVSVVILSLFLMVWKSLCFARLRYVCLDPIMMDCRHGPYYSEGRWIMNLYTG
jgi:hypothetical protein